MNRLASLLLLCLVTLLAGCGASNASSASGFSTTWQNDGGQSIARIEQRLRALPAVANARVVVGVSDTGLVGATLDGKSHWVHPGASVSLPAIAGNLVIVAEGDQIVALEASSGQKV